MNHNNHYYGNKSQNSSKSRKYNNDNNNGNNDNNLELQIHHQPYQQRYQQQQCRQQNIQNRHRQQHCRQQPYRPQHYRFKVDSRNLHRHDVNGDDDGDGSDGKREEVGQHQFEPDSYYNNNKTYPRNGERMRYDEHNRHYNNSNNNEKEPHFATIDYYENNGNNNISNDICKNRLRGKITFHGPGQLVCYPILNLNNFKLSVRSYVASIEKLIIDTCSEYKIKARTTKDTGVWVENEKICAIGIQVQRFITSHGFALNCNTDLRWFNHIIPCGIEGKSVTSITKELNKRGGETNQEISVEQVLPILFKKFNTLLGGGDNG
ncbi:15660_t:CDS:2, partial [Entrophospora sp. SA101]